LNLNVVNLSGNTKIISRPVDNIYIKYIRQELKEARLRYRDVGYMPRNRDHNLGVGYEIYRTGAGLIVVVQEAIRNKKNGLLHS
jgi:hypothetical protein